MRELPGRFPVSGGVGMGPGTGQILPWDLSQTAFIQKPSCRMVGDQRERRDPSGGIVLLGLNELLSPIAPAKLLP